MTSDPFSRIQVGDTAELSHTITARDVDGFAELTGDDNPLHMDEEFASTTNLRKRVVHGMLTASFISTIIGTKLPGKGALWYEQNLKFLRPVRIGETIRILATVLHKSPAQRLLVISTDIYDQAGSKVLGGEAKVKVMESIETGGQIPGAPKGAIIVTGSSRGIGAAVAKALAGKGFPVAVNYLADAGAADRVVADITAAGGRAVAIQADVADAGQVGRLVREAEAALGPLHGIVNNASPAIRNAPFQELPWEEMQRHLSTQVGGAFHLAQAALPGMLERGQGCIVTISSIFADNLPPAQMCAYVAAKSALNGLTRALAVELGPKGIRVNAVAPGMTQTDMIADVPEKAKMVAKMQTPLRRLAAPEDIAGVVAFLFGDEARHVHGQIIRVCGGAVMP